MNPDDFPAPQEGFVLTHFLVVSDQDRSREFYRSLFDGQVLVERDPVIMKVADIARARVYKEWSAKGPEFLTEPEDHGREIRAYIRDPDGHLIEVGQARR
jgi:catechol 2,3-dioxygenase-like lactoylglutathione lyase family enzyme